MTAPATAARDQELAYRDGYEHLAEELEKPWNENLCQTPLRSGEEASSKG